MPVINLLVLLFFTFLSNAYCEQVRTTDTNTDGAADQWLHYDGQDLVRMEEDFDFDGNPDKRAVFFYRNGEKYKVEIDSNMDALPDGWSYHRQGFRYRIESDTNYDGVADYIINNDTGVTGIDSDYDGKLDIKEDARYRWTDQDHDGVFELEQAITMALELWLGREHPDYAWGLQQYMKNTQYKHKSGIK